MEYDPKYYECKVNCKKDLKCIKKCKHTFSYQLLDSYKNQTVFLLLSLTTIFIFLYDNVLGIIIMSILFFLFKYKRNNI